MALILTLKEFFFWMRESFYGGNYSYAAQRRKRECAQRDKAARNVSLSGTLAALFYS